MEPTPRPDTATVYLYIDEAGNLDFSEHGTRFFALTGVVMRRPFRHLSGLLDAKYDALEAGLDLEYFHASEDRQVVRDRVLDRLESYVSDLAAYAVVVDKRALTSGMRQVEAFYPAVFSRLVDGVVAGEEIAATATRLIVVTDTLPVRRERSLVTKALKRALHERAKGAFEHWVFHHASRSDINLQVAASVSWCVYRRAARADVRSFSRVEPCVKSVAGLD